MKTTFTQAKCYLLAACAFVFLNPVSAQQNEPEHKHCGSTFMLESLYKRYPGLQQQAELKHAQSWEEGRRNLENNRDFTSPTYIIPVVFHIIHDNGPENISDAQVLDQVMILNRDFRMNNADTSVIYTTFTSIAADTKIEFRLAQIDPDGNCTNGIDRIQSMETYVGDDGSKLNQWDPEKYLNVWVVANITSGAAGYAYFPGTVDGFLYPIDGIMIRHDYIGSIGTSMAVRARALTHEVGHYLSLPHVWGNNNSPGVACGDDGISDTPVTMGWTYCPLPQNAAVCDTIVENYQNYMDYSYCSVMFTQGQKDVMHYTLNSAVAGRNNLWSATNLAATGCLNTQPTCAPHADFEPSETMICEGGTITLNDRSWSSDATAWNWTMSGPATYTSTAQNPTFSNITATGYYTVQLIASNSAGSDTMTRTDYILVSPDAAALTGSYSEGFENPNVFYLGYISNNRYGNGSYFQQTNTVGYTGTGSALLNNYGNSDWGDKDELITPSYYLYGMTGAHLTFRYSYATTNMTAGYNRQELRVFRSTDCGATWFQIYMTDSVNMINGGYSANYYVPQNSSYWSLVDIPLTSVSLTPNTRFKFEFTSSYDGIANNLYIDDINISWTNVGMNDPSQQAAFDVYPNPGDGSSNIVYTLDEQSAVQADLYDMSGRLVRNIYSGEQAAGNYTLPVSDNADLLAPGTYFIQMVTGDQVSTRKYVVAQAE